MYASYLTLYILTCLLLTVTTSLSSIMFSKTSLVAAAMGLFLATKGKCAG